MLKRDSEISAVSQIKTLCKFHSQKSLRFPEQLNKPEKSPILHLSLFSFAQPETLQSPETELQLIKPSVCALNFIMGSYRRCSFQITLKTLKELRLIADKCYSAARWFLYSALAACLAHSAVILCGLFGPNSQVQTLSNAGLTCLSVVSTSQSFNKK